MSKSLIAVPLGAVLLGAAFLAARPRAPEPGAAPRPARPPEKFGCDPPAGESHAAPPRPAAAAIPFSEVERELRRRAADTARLNELQDYLASGLAEGRISASQIVELFRAEADPAVLDLLQGVLALNPEAADEPGILDAFLRFASADASRDRRQAALAFLSSAWDKDGRVRHALFEVGRRDPDEGLRLAALSALQGYAAKNGEHAGAVNAGLLALAQGESQGEVRAQALSALTMSAAGEESLRQLASYAGDPTPAVRLAAAERLAEAPSPHQGVAARALEEALARETESGAKPFLLGALVRAGAPAEAIRRAGAKDPELWADAEEYVTILSRGTLDWEAIAAEKARLEAARAK